MGLELIYPAHVRKQGGENLFFPLFDTPAVRGIEAKALERSGHASGANHYSQDTLMQRAGFALSRLIRAKYPHARHIWVVAGAGNNGGDAIEAAACLHGAGYSVHVTWLGSPEKASVDTKQAYIRATEVGVCFAEKNDDAFGKTCDLIIDGLFGIGIDAKRMLSAKLEALIQKINALQAPVIAVDVPSGLLTDTGSIIKTCVRADTTLTFLTLKPGLFTCDGLEYSGEIWLETLDDTQNNFQAIAQPCAHLYAGSIQKKQRALNTHKGSFGGVIVIGGSKGMTGAALLASRAAITGGAGRVYTCLLDQPSALSVDIQSPELMFRAFDDVMGVLNAPKTVVACGCGAGLEIEKILPKLLTTAIHLVLDADALNAVAANNELQGLLCIRSQQAMATIITPHPLEAAKLLNVSTNDVQADRLAVAQALADRYQVVCVLKGSGSVVSAPGCMPFVNSSGNAALATAGSGDVLTGYLAACWSPLANGMRDGIDHHGLQRLAVQAVWQHGYAANRWRDAGYMGVLPAGQLIEFLSV